MRSKLHFTGYFTEVDVGIAFARPGRELGEMGSYVVTDLFR